MRKACADLLPHELVWRKKAQFDEGSGTVAALQDAMRLLTGETGEVGRKREGEVYEAILRERYIDPDFILANAGRWVADRVTVGA